MAQNFALLDIGTPELLVVLVIILLLFGAKKLPELSRSIGQSVKELRGGMSGETDEKKDQTTKKTKS